MRQPSKMHVSISIYLKDPNFGGENATKIAIGSVTAMKCTVLPHCQRFVESNFRFHAYI